MNWLYLNMTRSSVFFNNTRLMKPELPFYLLIWRKLAVFFKWKRTDPRMTNLGKWQKMAPNRIEHGWLPSARGGVCVLLKVNFGSDWHSQIDNLRAFPWLHVNSVLTEQSWQSRHWAACCTMWVFPQSGDIFMHAYFKLDWVTAERHIYIFSVGKVRESLTFKNGELQGLATCRGHDIWKSLEDDSLLQVF